jgi:hypothetical protein
MIGTDKSTVDMSVKYEDKFSSEDTNFGHIRDSFYILMTMNQFDMKPEVSSRKVEAEGLLRIVLFSKDLELRGSQKSLKEYRRTLAKALRRRRKRGVVPVFISTAWFLFSLAISIQSAFGLIGNNAEAHDLALGLLTGWMPIMIMAGIVDRNPFSVDDVRKPLNELINLVCESLQDKTLVTKFLATLEASDDETKKMRERVHEIVHNTAYLRHNFFSRFAGQGRLRWHYGCAHSILSDIENAWIADRGRDWLRDEKEARAKLVLGSTDHGLFWFDFRELWQVASAAAAVTASCVGAFILSYFTPTVGLGCRSLGYLIFGCVSLSLLVLEFLVWWWTSDEREERRQRQQSMERRPTIFEQTGTVQQAEYAASILKHTRSWGAVQRDNIEQVLEDWYPKIRSRGYSAQKREDKEKRIRARMHKFFQNTHDYSTRQWLHRLVFVPIEIFNTIWLVYIVLAQTFGAYSNCKCVTSLYGFTGGYVDLSQASTTNSPYVQSYWSAGTALSCAILGLGLIYVVLEWCLQAHISTENVKSARKGLQRTRRFRRVFHWPRWASQKCIIFINNMFGRLKMVFGTILGSSKEIAKNGQKTLFWHKEVTYDYAKELYLSPKMERGRRLDEEGDRRADREELPVWGTPPTQPTPTFFSPTHFHRRSNEDEATTATTHLLYSDAMLSPHDRSLSGPSGRSSYDAPSFSPTFVEESEDQGLIAGASGARASSGYGRLVTDGSN